MCFAAARIDDHHYVLFLGDEFAAGKFMDEYVGEMTVITGQIQFLQRFRIGEACGFQPLTVLVLLTLCTLRLHELQQEFLKTGIRARSPQSVGVLGKSGAASAVWRTAGSAPEQDQSTWAFIALPWPSASYLRRSTDCTHTTPVMSGSGLSQYCRRMRISSWRSVAWALSCFKTSSGRFCRTGAALRMARPRCSSSGR